MNCQTEYNQKLVSLEEAAKQVKSGDHVYIGCWLGTPTALVLELCNRYQELENVLIHSGMLMYPFPFLKNAAEYKGHINYKTMFLAAAEVPYKESIEITSLSLSENFWWIENVVKPDVTMLEVSPPDRYGYMSIGPAAGQQAWQAVQSGKTVIVQVNSKIPYVYGDRKMFVHLSEVDYVCECDEDLFQFEYTPPTPEEAQIAKYAAELIDDGDTLMAGLGSIPEAVFKNLTNHKDLGIYTECLFGGMVELIKTGAVTCAKKNYFPGKVIMSMYAGNNDTYDYVDRNQFLEYHATPFVNDPANIAKNDNYVSINGAVLLDTTGQAVAESIGLDQIRGLGGQFDHMMGARMSKGGKGIITMTSTYTDHDGKLSNRILTTLPPGTAVTTPRAIADFFVTEYGVAHLKGKSIPDRVKAMVAIAHPQFREQLLKEASEAGMLRD